MLEKDGQEFLIGETSNGKKYYMSKMKNGSGGQPSRVASEPSDNIITDNVEYFNPKPTVTLGDNIPENLKTTTPTYKKQLEEALGLTEDNWDQEPNFYSKEKEDEAYAILSQATGKSVKWLRLFFKSAR